MDAAYVGAAGVSELSPSGACLHVRSTFCSDHSYLSMSARGIETFEVLVDSTYV